MPADNSSNSMAALDSAIEQTMIADRDGFRRRLAGLRRRQRQGKPFDQGLERLQADVQASQARLKARYDNRPKIEFVQDLPVNERRAEIARAIEENQVVVICGETGSGKSTQLPKICLELGRGVNGLIAHTQPRRIAARTLSSRIADELHSEVGKAVGYKIRFTDQVGPETYIKLVTDGMLLAEIQGDRDLSAYDTIIIDEAHERSLNIDFLLGYLYWLLPRRPDLKLIITSATIDPQRFARHYHDAPILEVSGRTYPVEVRYRPLAEDDYERDQRTAIVEAADELCREGPGDILVFLSGEREIRETAEVLRKHHPPHTEILPLYARLSGAEQARVFQPGGKRRIVLATNVAETSITVPGIRYVIDTGYARISRYSYRTKVQRLPVEPIAQASANQRAGRCGRTGPGICIRLYSEDDFLSRPEFTEPEILRTNLAAVILQMKGLGLGDVEEFPFVEAPDRRFVNDGFKLLLELGAVDEQRELTNLGRRLARLPVDPRIGRMLLAAERDGSLKEVLVIAAALSVQDPRERPLEAQQAADQAHEVYRDDKSDFASYLKLWDDLREQARHLSRRKLQTYCRERFLSYKRILEWQDVHRQLKELVKGMGLRENQEPAEYPQLHRALLTGLLSNVALRDEESVYLGARNVKLNIHPGSGLFKRRPKWIMAAELVETQRLYARDVAEVKPDWIEALGQHLVSRSYAEPHWQSRKARVGAYETVSLYGLVLTARRLVDFGRIDPETSRQIFIHEGLVQGRYRSRGRFQQHNRRLIEEIEQLEAKARRRDLLVDEEAMYAFYDVRVPAGIVSGADFESWRGRAEREQPRLLYMSRDDLMQREAHDLTGGDFPDHLRVRGLVLPLEYHFDPGDPLDGLVVRVPLAALNQLAPEPFEWLVPGLIEEKVVTLIRALPKQLRRNFVPAPDYARAVLQAVPYGEGLLTEAVRRELKRMTGVDVPIDAWDGLELPSHLRITFRVLDDDGTTLASDRSLEALQRRLGDAASREFSAGGDSEWERDGITRWDFDELPETVEIKRQGVVIRGYPAVVDQRDSVALRLSDSPEQAARDSRAGTRRLYMLELAQQTRYLRRNLPGLNEMCLRFTSVGSCDDLREDLLTAAFDHVFLTGELPRKQAEFRARLDKGRGELVATAEDLCTTVAEALKVYHSVQKQLKRITGLSHMEALRDMQEQMSHLIYVGFVSSTPADRLQHLPRYLQGMERRLSKLAADPGRDKAGLQAIRPHWQRLWEREAIQRKKGITDPELTRYRWMLEEYRVSLFAQELRTAEPVSEKRLQQQWSLVT